jgi:hypothetical protein
MTGITIPAAALEAAAQRIYETWRDRDSTQLLPPWKYLVAQYRQTWLDQARAACLAMMTAWPGMRISWLALNDGAIVLPLPPQEASDE